MIDVKATFEKYEKEFLKFERIEKKNSTRPDLHAFLLLSWKFPRDRDIIAAAEHDQIWLDVQGEDLAEKATDDDILQLVRCGVMLDNDTDSLFMFA